METLDMAKPFLEPFVPNSQELNVGQRLSGIPNELPEAPTFVTQEKPIEHRLREPDFRL